MEGEALVHVSVLHLEHSQDSRPSSPAQHSSEEPDPLPTSIHLGESQPHKAALSPSSVPLVSWRGRRPKQRIEEPS